MQHFSTIPLSFNDSGQLVHTNMSVCVCTYSMHWPKDGGAVKSNGSLIANETNES